MNTLLVSLTNTIGTVISDKQKGAGYHNITNSLHTLVYSVTDFKGSIKLQGTLALDPADIDWVDIPETVIGGDSSVFSALEPVNFTGNFVWIRAVYTLEDGTITEIRYNY